MTTLINNYQDQNKWYLSLSSNRFFKSLKQAKKPSFNVIITIENTTTNRKNEDASYINSESFESLSKIDSFAKFQYNWNSYGAQPFSKAVLDNAKKTIMSLCYQPEIFPVADGSIQFEYDRGKSHLEMQIFEDHIESYSIDDNGNEKEFTDVFDVRIIKEMVDRFYE